jgi:hypothetical protein
MPQILTTEYIFECPHKGVGTFPILQQKNWSIGNGFVLLDGDTGVIAGCTSLCCISFSTKSLGLTAVYYESQAFGRKFAMLTTDLMLSNSGFPMKILSSPPFKLTNNTVPPGMLKIGQPFPEFLADEAAPIVTRVSPTGVISWNKTAPITVKYSIDCKHLDATAVEVRLMPKNIGFFPVLISKSSSELDFHTVKEGDYPDPHEIDVNLTPELHAKISSLSAILLVRVCSKRGVSNYSEIEIIRAP